MGLVSRIFSGIVVFRSSGSVSGKKKLLQFFFAGFLFFREAVVFAFSGLFRLCPIKTFLVKEDELDVIPACSVETIGGFVFAGDVFSVSVAVV
uniref:Uncharacterized protein n=1 Tax=Brassica campestris TaxID=3711 RepID=A0A3P6BMG0_BRACM|nr:unnamed protein product [Brassica rapa]